MKRASAMKCLFTLLSITGVARADLYSLQPSPANLNNLDHNYYYKWGINWTLPAGQSITNVNLFFDNIDNWQPESTDQLFITIFNSLSAGTTSTYDGPDGPPSNNIPDNANADLIYTYTDPQDQDQGSPGPHPADLTVPIPAKYWNPSAAGFNGWMTDGNFGFGFDPDCHYFNSGVYLEIETSKVPAPDASLLGMLGVGIVGWARRRVRSL